MLGEIPFDCAQRTIPYYQDILRCFSVTPVPSGLSRSDGVMFHRDAARSLSKGWQAIYTKLCTTPLVRFALSWCWVYTLRSKRIYHIGSFCLRGRYGTIVFSTKANGIPGPGDVWKFPGDEFRRGTLRERGI